MPELSELIREYCGLLVQETRISERKERLRAAIADEMTRRNLKSTATEYGSVARTDRFKLHPRPEAVLEMLSNEDLLPFASFTPQRVKELLVPRYGREALARLFDIEKSETLVIKRPPGTFAKSRTAASVRSVRQSDDELASLSV